jgi:hypothetical protein
VRKTDPATTPVALRVTASVGMMGLLTEGGSFAAIGWLPAPSFEWVSVERKVFGFRVVRIAGLGHQT